MATFQILWVGQARLSKVLQHTRAKALAYKLAEQNCTWSRRRKSFFNLCCCSQFKSFKANKQKNLDHWWWLEFMFFFHVSFMQLLDTHWVKFVSEVAGKRHLKPMRLEVSIKARFCPNQRQNREPDLGSWKFLVSSHRGRESVRVSWAQDGRCCSRLVCKSALTEDRALPPAPFRCTSNDLYKLLDFHFLENDNVHFFLLNIIAIKSILRI